MPDSACHQHSQSNIFLFNLDSGQLISIRAHAILKAAI